MDNAQKVPAGFTIDVVRSQSEFGLVSSYNVELKVIIQVCEFHNIE